MLDEHAATELKLYIDNDGDLYRRQTTSILKNLATKKARGIYKHDLAVKAFGYLVQAGAKKYADEFEPTMRVWHQIFDAPTRRSVAEALTKDFEGEYALGNYDHLLPKKYQKASKATVHATKKTQAQIKREVDDIIDPKPRVLKISGDKSFASQRSITATVQYPGESPMRVKFMGPSTKGSSGPVVMITGSGTETFVYDPSRFGTFGTAWVRRFFGEA